MGLDLDTNDTEDAQDDKTVKEKTPVVSLQDRPRSPTAADISRPRKTKKNEPSVGKHQCSGNLSSDHKGVSPSQCVREFENESSTVFHGHLFCSL